MKYCVKIEEVSAKCFVVEADTEEQAERIAEEAFCSGYVDMMKNGYYENSFECTGRASELDISCYDEIELEE